MGLPTHFPLLPSPGQDLRASALLSLLSSSQTPAAFLRWHSSYKPPLPGRSLTLARAAMSLLRALPANASLANTTTPLQVSHEVMRQVSCTVRS